MPASAQTAGTAVSLLPPQNAAGSNPSLSLQVATERLQASQAAVRALTQENTHGFQLVDSAADSNLFPPLQASLDRAQTALANRVAAQTEEVNLLQAVIDASQQRILRNIRGPAPEERSSRTEELVASSVPGVSIGGTGASSQRTETSADDTTSLQEPELPSFDMSTREQIAECTASRKEARARLRAEAQAAELGQSLSPVRNPSPAMTLWYNYLMAKKEWEQRQLKGSLVSDVRMASDLLSISSGSTSTSLHKSSGAVADMHWCIDNLDKIRDNVGDSRHSDWSDYWEAGYKKTKPWGKNTFVPKKLVLGTNSMWAPFYHSGPEVPDDRDPPHFRVSAELFGRMLHTFGREYISRDDNRKFSTELDKHLKENVAQTNAALSDAS
jgi:hypothetical protein